jgi:hypothetical protein
MLELSWLIPRNIHVGAFLRTISISSGSALISIIVGVKELDLKGSLKIFVLDKDEDSKVKVLVLAFVLLNMFTRWTCWSPSCESWLGQLILHRRLMFSRVYFMLCCRVRYSILWALGALFAGCCRGILVIVLNLWRLY